MRFLTIFCVFHTIQTYATTSIIVAKETLEISHESLIVDGKKLELKCPNESKFKNFLTIKFDNTTLNFQCHNDYLGGVIIEGYPNLRLGGLSGDAGTTWGEISKFEIKNKKLKLYRMLFSKKDPSVDCEYIPPESSKKFKTYCKKAKVECKTSYQELFYNGSKFIKLKEKLSKAPIAFSLKFPEDLNKRCGKLWSD